MYFSSLGESDFQNVGCDPGWPSHLEYKFEWWGPDFGIMGERSSPPTRLDEEEEIWAFHGYPCMKQYDQYEALLVFFLQIVVAQNGLPPIKSQ